MRLSGTLVVQSLGAFALALMLNPSYSHASGDDHGAATEMTAQKAFSELVSGNDRFVKGMAAHPKQDSGLRSELANGQKPHTIILSCSDSRVPPELVFDQGLGELFVVRVAGNVLGAATVASIEYAVEHLGSSLIVVMGHESCGAVKATLEIPPTKTAGSPDLDTLLHSIRPSIEDSAGRGLASQDKTFARPVKQNVDGVAKRLLQRSKIVRAKVESGKLVIAPAIYRMASGKVDFWNVDQLDHAPSSATEKLAKAKEPAHDDGAHH